MSSNQILKDTDVLATVPSGTSTMDGLSSLFLTLSVSASIAVAPILADASSSDSIPQKPTQNKSFEMISVEGAFDSWFDSFADLKEAQKKENYSEDLILPSSSTVARTKSWIFKAYRMASHLPAPEVTPDGEGQLDVEWEIGNKSVSLYIRKDEKIGDRIIFNNGNKYESYELTEEKLESILKQL